MLEFKEFPNPEEKDYDIFSAHDGVDRPGEINSYFMEIIDMVGFLEDGEWVKYGITENEYMHPTAETVEKIRKAISHPLDEETTRKIK